MTVSANDVAVIKTSEGEMGIEFWADVAPKTVENFKKLSREGFYDDTCFHRVSAKKCSSKLSNTWTLFWNRGPTTPAPGSGFVDEFTLQCQP